MLGRKGEFWQKESYDHLIRYDEDFARCMDYIAQNPVKAGLAGTAQEFRFSSAHEARHIAGESPAVRDRAGAVAGEAPALHKREVGAGESPAPRKRETGAGEAPAPQKRARAVAGAEAALPLDPRAAEIARMEWPQLKDSVAGCTACALHKGRNKTVFGVGDEHAEWLFIGEGPGADEDAKGEPFVGQAGKLLDNMLAAIGLKRGNNVYIANVIKCRPPGNRNPEPLEAAQCEPYLHRQIELIRPKLIVALGKVAAVNLLKREASIASLRGKVLEYRGTPLIITYHPAYLLRSLPDKAKAWEDLCFAVETMKGLQSAEPVPI
ncbi:MAG: uracil-DNA glycosylase [Betaproteobacteria bacterium]|nr:uracil-DNA glycosylase [Betaproteobacteria bacterium]